MTTRRSIAAVAFIATAARMPVVAAGPAAAAAYRYWSYWLGSDTGWSFAHVGPAFRSPADGTVEGWRFAINGVTGDNLPGFSPDFAEVCGDTPAQEDRKRVALVVDPGSTADAINGEATPGPWAICIVAESRATGYDILRAATTVRAERGLICGIGGYPSRGCADIVADPTPTPTPTPTPKPTPTPTPTPEARPSPSTSPRPEVAAPTSPGPSSSGPTPSGPGPSARTDTRVEGISDAGVRASSQPARTAAAADISPSPDPRWAPPPESAPSPEPSMSMLTAPLDTPPADGGGGLSTIAAGLAVAGIAGLGGAAILRMRRAAS